MSSGWGPILTTVRAVAGGPIRRASGVRPPRGAPRAARCAGAPGWQRAQTTRRSVMAKLRVGLVGGGGPGNFFGHVHKRAIALDNSRQLVAGALRSDPEAAMARAAAS